MLYKQQSQQGGARVKFLQNNLWLACTPMKIDYYINIIYKDIYARYLIIRGLKV